jgi:hypothetical protein
MMLPSGCGPRPNSHERRLATESLVNPRAYPVKVRMKPGVASVQAASLSPENCRVVVREDNRVQARESRRFAGAGRPWSLMRQGERRGHHRDLRAGHVHTGVAWELERTVISLWREPVRHAGTKNGARRRRGHLRTRAANPKGDTNPSGGHKVSGSELKAKRLEMEKR